MNTVLEEKAIAKDKCFVVMPFGVKPIPDEPNHYFDFDKVYRIVIRRAIEEAGMEPIRADEQTGSHIIHSEMFKELRDRAFVLADLSLGNPNVYYELGIRHVLSPGGTILMCREGTELPFDIRLSRVIFYRYNGKDIDWEVVEEVVLRLKDALMSAKEKRPDSPVHALLEKVFPECQNPTQQYQASASEIEMPKTENTENKIFEEMAARQWVEQKKEPGELIKQYGDSLFGARALGELCMISDLKGEQIVEIAVLLYFKMQYDLSFRILDKLHCKPGGYKFTPEDYVKFGSVISERDHSKVAADEGLKKMKMGLEIAQSKVKSENNNPYQIFSLYNSIGGLHLWKWHITKSTLELKNSIENLEKAVESVKGIDDKTKRPVGRIAQLYLRLLILKRIQEGSTQRYDREGYISIILKIDESQAIDEREESYLRWYKIIAYADSGNERKVREGTINAIQKDVLLNNKEVGGIQYVMLRRFIENNLEFLQNHTLLGLISQDLQYSTRLTKIEY
ncbi:MAG: hypothetical protein KKA81_08590 [Bacteroidetes bacterium]|nr:hypothetical protein [Bacteroidota bacterium]